ncbi:MAG: hypothetical protein ACLR4Z_15210 [Butyricicoccaceae bacterium]
MARAAGSADRQDQHRRTYQHQARRERRARGRRARHPLRGQNDGHILAAKDADHSRSSGSRRRR